MQLCQPQLQANPVLVTSAVPLPLPVRPFPDTNCSTPQFSFLLQGPSQLGDFITKTYINIVDNTLTIFLQLNTAYLYLNSRDAVVKSMICTHQIATKVVHNSRLQGTLLSAHTLQTTGIHIVKHINSRLLYPWMEAWPEEDAPKFWMLKISWIFSVFTITICCQIFDILNYECCFEAPATQQNC
jgi:hypothetical protein